MNLERIKRALLYFAGVILLPVTVGILVVWLLEKIGVLEGSPWHYLVGIVAAEFLLFAVRDRLPFAAAIGLGPEDAETRARGSLRKIAREARHLARETQRILRKYGHRLEDSVYRDIAQSLEALRAALAEKDREAILKSFRRLDLKVEEHLTFARKSTLREYAESIGIAVFVALLLRAFVVEAFKIPTGSMIPTLEIGDHIFVNKYLYGLRIPYTGIRFFDARQPRRGEVIVFIAPRDPDRKDFIKRIIGIAGDKIEFIDGQLHINDQPVPRCSLGRYPYEDVVGQRREQHESEAYLESLGGFSYVTMYHPGGGDTSDSGPWHVRPGQVFVMGDNRDSSSDSRAWAGVPVENIKGRALFVWWSPQLQRLGHGVMTPPSAPPALETAIGVCLDRFRRESGRPTPSR